MGSFSGFDLGGFPGDADFNAQEDELVGGARVGDELDVRLLRQGDEVRILERGLEREVARLENEGGVEGVPLGGVRRNE